jgi:hypothetical protein
MSEQSPKGPYVYQPFGSISHPNHAAADRLWGVGGVSLFTTIEGLTKDEATAIVRALQGEPDGAALVREAYERGARDLADWLDEGLKDAGRLEDEPYIIAEPIEAAERFLATRQRGG